MNNAASLTKMKKDELVELCKQKGLTGYSKLKKDELVALLKKYFGEWLEIETGTVTKEQPRFEFFK